MGVPWGGRSGARGLCRLLQCLHVRNERHTPGNQTSSARRGLGEAKRTELRSKAGLGSVGSLVTGGLKERGSLTARDWVGWKNDEGVTRQRSPLQETTPKMSGATTQLESVFPEYVTQSFVL